MNIADITDYTKSLLSLIRVKQYIKNLLIFAPAFFSAHFLDLEMLQRLCYAFLGFSLIASFIYILNDIKDINEDRQHPEKSKRALASGRISVHAAALTGILCLSGGLFILKDFLLIAFLYLLINLLYVYKIKNYALIDIIFVSSGYILRLVLGSMISNAALSCWIIIMTFLLSMFLASAKRYDDLKYGSSTRKNMHGYNAPFLENMMSIFASVTVVSYILYCVSPEVTNRFNCSYVYITAFFVLTGILRYLQLTFVFKESGSPSKIIYSDMFLKAAVLLWVLSFAWIIYF